LSSLQLAFSHSRLKGELTQETTRIPLTLHPDYIFKSSKEVAMKVLRMRSWNFHADNLEQMMRFYQNALGAEVRTQHTVGGVNVTRLRAGETGLGLFNAAEKRALVMLGSPTSRSGRRLCGALTDDDPWLNIGRPRSHD